MFLVDSHCHLNQLDYKNVHKNISDVLYKANQKGVKLVLSVSTDISDYDEMVNLVGCRTDVVFSCGVHPINVCDTNVIDYSRLYDMASKKKVVAIGETGLDYLRGLDNQRNQKFAFQKHISIARDINKPLIVHSRNSIQDTIAILIEGKADECQGVLHCFSEDVNYLKSLLDISFYISFSGMITFRNLHGIKKVIEYVPLDRMLLETDAPYLTPVPYRGQENQPAYIYDIAKYIARIKNITITQLASVTTSNFYNLFHATHNNT